MTDTDTEVLDRITDERPEHGDLPGALAAAAPRRWSNRATPVLLGVVLLAGGFLGGVATQKQWGRTGTTAPAQARMPGGMPSGGPRMPASDATTGTLQSVTDTSLTMRTAAGRTVTVRIAGGTRILQSTTLAQLRAGRPVTVQGSTATDGTVTATEVTVS